ncbi:hypothetical protein [Imhoffiella purpurea]|uniref:hypothetical protein n=1 Tax=Imhoffiella purpurea TaxID=1249627 RepID=UPI0012FDED78|nr:hypothetical protein [Imhoffiella purpurea]
MKAKPKSTADWQAVIERLSHGLEVLESKQATLQEEQASLALPAALGDIKAQARLDAIGAEVVQADHEASTMRAALSGAQMKKAKAAEAEQHARDMARAKDLRQVIADRRAFLQETFQPAARRFAEAIKQDLEQRAKIRKTTEVEVDTPHADSLAIAALVAELESIGVCHHQRDINLPRLDAPKAALEHATTRRWTLEVNAAIALALLHQPKPLRRPSEELGQLSGVLLDQVYQAGTSPLAENVELSLSKSPGTQDSGEELSDQKGAQDQPEAVTA